MLRFGSRGWEHWTQAACVMVAVKLASFAVVGIYRSIWRYVSVADLLLFARASILGSLAGSVILYIAYGEVAPELVLLDSLLLFVLLAASRLTFRVLGEVLSPPACRNGRRVLIYGAGDGGELLLRELLNNVALDCTPVGFADDDPLKQGKVIHGLRVFGGQGQLQKICEEQRIDEVYLSSTRFTAHRVAEIRDLCQTVNLPLKQMRIRLEEVNLDVYAQDTVEVFDVARHHRPSPATGLTADLGMK
jgi:UDP-GlcNAc:undecaprenyl-phosphate GlcNAc-1-phosphate transferase